MVAGSGAVFVLLFGVGIFVADLRASYPALSMTIDEIETYFAENRGAVRALGFFHAFAAVSLLVFGAHVGARLRAAADSRTLPDVALGGGVTAAAMLFLDAMLFWTLAAPPSQPADAALLRSLHTLSYLAGGAILVLPLAVFIGAVSAAALRAGLLPRWLAWWGVVATVESLLYGSTLATWTGPWSPGGVLVVGAVLPIGWILVASISLFRNPSAGTT